MFITHKGRPKLDGNNLLTSMATAVFNVSLLPGIAIGMDGDGRMPAICAAVVNTVAQAGTKLNKQRKSLMVMLQQLVANYQWLYPSQTCYPGGGSNEDCW